MQANQQAIHRTARHLTYLQSTIKANQQALHLTARHLKYLQFKPISKRNIIHHTARHLAKENTGHRNEQDIWHKYRNSTTKAKLSKP
jgi:hypothetical protein